MADNSIIKNLEIVKNEIGGAAKLVAVSKTRNETEILEAYNSGHRVFGENKVQELVRKYENLPKDIEWHMIGHLQSNKVKFIVPFVNLIHAVDSLKLMHAINKESSRINKVTDCLLQLHIAKEETKFGLSLDESIGLLSSNDFKGFKNIRVTGLMGMATYTDNVDTIRDEFRCLKTSFEKIKNEFFADKNCSFKELSMGMSGDYKVAIEEGSTIVRIGSNIFGERCYLR